MKKMDTYSKVMTAVNLILLCAMFILILPEAIDEPETVIIPIYNHETAVAEIYASTIAPLTPTPDNVIFVTMTPTPGIYYPGGVTHHAGLTTP